MRPKKTLDKEISFIGKALRGLGSLGGSTLGAMVGQPTAGSAVGSSLGAAVSRWLGAGDYTVSSNSITARAASAIPNMHKTGQSIVVRHKEFVTSIAGSTSFKVQQALPINPGLPGTFPWLSSIASRFQEYEVKGMVYHYVPTSGTFNGTSAALGSVMIQTSYRSTDVAPTSKAEMMNEYWSNEVVPFETMAHPIECDPKENVFNVHYIRNTAITTGEPLLYDLGKTFVATQGQSTTDIVGDLWVTYEIELKKPIIASVAVASPGYFGASWNAPSTGNYFPGTPTTQTGGLAVVANGKTITFPAGNAGPFFLVVQVLGTSMGAVASIDWNGTLTTTNVLSVAYDGTNTVEGTIVSGTNPTTNALRWVLAFTLLDPAQPATILFPNFLTTSGTFRNSSVFVATYSIA